MSANATSEPLNVQAKIKIDRTICPIASSCRSAHYHPDLLSEYFGKEVTEGDIVVATEALECSEQIAEELRFMLLRDLVFATPGEPLFVEMRGKSWKLQAVEDVEGTPLSRIMVHKGAERSTPEVGLLHGPKMNLKEGEVPRSTDFFSFDLKNYVWCLQAGDHMKRCYYRSFSMVSEKSHDEFCSEFQRLDLLGQGCRGKVYKVAASDGRVLAAKVESLRSTVDCVVIAIAREILDLELSPHLLRVEGLHRMQGCYRHKEAPPDGHFLFPHKEEVPRGAADGWALIQLFELLDTDLYTLGKKGACGEPALDSLAHQALRLQLFSVDHLLESYGVRVIDGGELNVMCKKVDESVVFRGKRIQDYSHLKYQIRERSYWIPQVGWVVKRIDYDLWKFGSHSEQKFKEKPVWEKSYKDFEVFATEPPAGSKVLDMTPGTIS